MRYNAKSLIIKSGNVQISEKVEIPNLPCRRFGRVIKYFATKLCEFTIFG